MQSLTKAQELDNSLAEVHYRLGNMYAAFHWDWKTSESEYNKALKIKPNFSDVYAAQSNLFAVLERTEESIKAGEIALKLDPYNIFNRVLYAATLMFARQYNESLNTCESVLKTDPNNFLCRNILPILYHQSSRYEDSLSAWKLLVTSFYNHAELSLDSIFEDGDPSAAYSRILNVLADDIFIHNDSVRFDVFNIAIIYACAGNREKAIQMLYKAYEDHNPNSLFLVNPVFDVIKNEPDYIELRNKMNLPLIKK
jgi:tetratricopeptide (TPR) repeat protein